MEKEQQKSLTLNEKIQHFLNNTFINFSNLKNRRSTVELQAVKQILNSAIIIEEKKRDQIQLNSKC